MYGTPKVSNRRAIKLEHSGAELRSRDRLNSGKNKIIKIHDGKQTRD
jgi:hypothetical protein